MALDRMAALRERRATLEPEQRQIEALEQIADALDKLASEALSIRGLMSVKGRGTSYGS